MAERVKAHPPKAKIEQVTEALRLVILRLALHPDQETLMAALDRLTALQATLAGIPAEIDSYVASEVAETEAALDPVLTQIESDTAAITAKVTPATTSTSTSATVEPSTTGSVA